MKLDEYNLYLLSSDQISPATPENYYSLLEGLREASKEDSDEWAHQKYLGFHQGKIDLHSSMKGWIGSVAHTYQHGVGGFYYFRAGHEEDAIHTGNQIPSYEEVKEYLARGSK